VTEKISNFGSNQLNSALAEINAEGNFPIAVITDLEGFPIAWAAASDQDPDMQAAVVALIQKTAAQVREQLGMAQTDEVSVYDRQGQRLVCRPFEANQHALILAVLVPDKQQAYRRLTNNAIRTIQRSWRL
jgi:predicted regulator of Ras-like GTPase activity (Roadblock/LC7/MglB family)